MSRLASPIWNVAEGAETFRLVPKLPAASIISYSERCGMFDGYTDKQKKHSRSCAFCLYEVYLPISQKRMRIAATSARVALFCGFSLPLEPLTMPLATAHCIASAA